MNTLNECLKVKKERIEAEKIRCMQALMYELHKRRSEILAMSSNTAWRLFRDSVSLATFCGSNGISYEVCRAVIQDLHDEALFFYSNEEISLTPKGVNTLCKLD